MSEADVGDDVFEDDPTVKALEERAAKVQAEIKTISERYLTALTLH